MTVPPATKAAAAARNVLAVKKRSYGTGHLYIEQSAWYGR
jgi:hypothetical protein